MCPLLIATENGFIDKVRLLCNNNVDILGKKDKLDRNLLHLLIEKGSKVNIEDINKETPLMLACKKNAKPIVELLISRGADVNHRNKNGETALIWTLNYSDKENKTKRIGHLEVARVLIECGTDLRLTNECNQNAAFLSIQRNNRQIFEMLIATDSFDLNHQYYNGNTLLHYVCFYDRKETYAELLIDKGVDLNIQNEDGKTPLDLAKEKNLSDQEKTVITGIETMISMLKQEAKKTDFKPI
jgi:ankyrin repeat protein